jgi:hypothetical protein
MSTCGYLCPKCEGAGFLSNNEICDWCCPALPPTKPSVCAEELADWISMVHEGPCCADRPEEIK